ncbi:MAG TPA: hypothetical protein VF077_13275 [Nitrospiraceae bacterium]
MPQAGAAAIPALISAGGAVIGGLASRSGARAQATAADQAAALQNQAANAGIAETARQFDTTQQNLRPWLNSGKVSLAQIMQMLGIRYNPVTGEHTATTPAIDSILKRDPEYQFQLEQGLNAINRSNAATTGVLNPRAVKSLERYGQGLASQTYTNRYNRLAALSGLGQTTGNQLGAFGAQAGANTANLYGQGANALSAGLVGGANAYTGGLQGIAGAFGQGAQNYMLWNALNNQGLFGGGGGFNAANTAGGTPMVGSFDLPPGIT